MKVYFSVMGIGLGHITRCLSITKHLEKNGITCVFSSFGKASQISLEKGFKTYDSKPVMWNQTLDGRVDFENTFLNGPLIFKQMINHYNCERKRIIKEKPDLIVTDTRYSTIPASKKIDTKRIYITNQPSFIFPKPEKNSRILMPLLQKIANRFNYWILSGQDEILLPDFPQPYSISKKHMSFNNASKRFKEKIRFVGPIASNRPEDIKKEEITKACKKYNVEPGNFIYIAFSGPGAIKKEIHDAIFDLFSDYSVPAIMGMGNTNDFKIHKKGNLFLVDGWIKERAELLDASSLVITRAGLSTLSEIVAFGKKAVVIPQSNQPEQESNALGIENLGLGKKIDSSLITKTVLKKEIKNLQLLKIDTNKIKKLAKEMNGEKKSAEIIINYLEKKES